MALFRSESRHEKARRHARERRQAWQEHLNQKTGTTEEERTFLSNILSNIEDIASSKKDWKYRTLLNNVLKAYNDEAENANPKLQVDEDGRLSYRGRVWGRTKLKEDEAFYKYVKSLPADESKKMLQELSVFAEELKAIKDVVGTSTSYSRKEAFKEYRHYIRSQTGARAEIGKQVRNVLHSDPDIQIFMDPFRQVVDLDYVPVIELKQRLAQLNPDEMKNSRYRYDVHYRPDDSGRLVFYTHVGKHSSKVADLSSLPPDEQKNRAEKTLRQLEAAGYTKQWEPGDRYTNYIKFQVEQDNNYAKRYKKVGQVYDPRTHAEKAFPEWANEYRERYKESDERTPRPTPPPSATPTQTPSRSFRPTSPGFGSTTPFRSRAGTRTVDYGNQGNRQRDRRFTPQGSGTPSRTLSRSFGGPSATTRIPTSMRPTTLRAPTSQAPTRTPKVSRTPQPTIHPDFKGGANYLKYNYDSRGSYRKKLNWLKMQGRVVSRHGDNRAKPKDIMGVIEDIYHGEGAGEPGQIDIAKNNLDNAKALPNSRKDKKRQIAQFQKEYDDTLKEYKEAKTLWPKQEEELKAILAPYTIPQYNRFREWMEENPETRGYFVSPEEQAIQGKVNVDQQFTLSPFKMGEVIEHIKRYNKNPPTVRPIPKHLTHTPGPTAPPRTPMPESEVVRLIDWYKANPSAMVGASGHAFEDQKASNPEFARYLITHPKVEPDLRYILDQFKKARMTPPPSPTPEVIPPQQNGTDPSMTPSPSPSPEMTQPPSLTPTPPRSLTPSRSLSPSRSMARTSGMANTRQPTMSRGAQAERTSRARTSQSLSPSPSMPPTTAMPQTSAMPPTTAVPTPLQTAQTVANTISRSPTRRVSPTLDTRTRQATMSRGAQAERSRRPLTSTSSGMTPSPLQTATTAARTIARTPSGEQGAGRPGYFQQGEKQGFREPSGALKGTALIGGDADNMSQDYNDLGSSDMFRNMADNMSGQTELLRRPSPEGFTSTIRSRIYNPTSGNTQRPGSSTSSFGGGSTPWKSVFSGSQTGGSYSPSAAFRPSGDSSRPSTDVSSDPMFAPNPDAFRRRPAPSAQASQDVTRSSMFGDARMGGVDPSGSSSTGSAGMPHVGEKAPTFHESYNLQDELDRIRDISAKLKGEREQDAAEDERASYSEGTQDAESSDTGGPNVTRTPYNRMTHVNDMLKWWREEGGKNYESSKAMAKRGQPGRALLKEAVDWARTRPQAYDLIQHDTKPKKDNK